ncbi:hypothetical protein ACN47E_000176 [Coniothyrium glycines]
MAKRSASPDRSEEHPAKKLKTQEPLSELDDKHVTPVEKSTHYSRLGAADTPTPAGAEKPVAEQESHENSTGTAVEPETVTPKKTAKAKRPIADCFLPWGTTHPKPDMALPDAHDFMGCKPVFGDGGPRPTARQPSARTSGAAAIPDLWENRGYLFEAGSRYRKYIGEKPDNVANLTASIDQHDGMVLKLIDMRIDKKTGQPRRTPHMYVSNLGTPEDWKDMQTIKCLNDRRRDAIDRTTRDLPWTFYEREIFLEIIQMFPDGSIWDWTEHHNYHFVGNYRWPSGFSKLMDLSEGRTVESVADEYKKYKISYDKGQTPPETMEVRRVHKNAAGKDIDEEVGSIFIAAFKGHMNDKLKARAAGKTTTYKRKRETNSQRDVENDNQDGAVEDDMPKAKKRRVAKAKTKNDGDTNNAEEATATKKTPKFRKRKAVTNNAENATPKKRSSKKSAAIVEDTIDQEEESTDDPHTYANETPMSPLAEEIFELAGGRDLDGIHGTLSKRSSAKHSATESSNQDFATEGTTTMQRMGTESDGIIARTCQEISDQDNTEGASTKEEAAAESVVVEDAIVDVLKEHIGTKRVVVEQDIAEETIIENHETTRVSAARPRVDTVIASTSATRKITLNEEYDEDEES